jgi:hypothetical protein
MSVSRFCEVMTILIGVALTCAAPAPRASAAKAPVTSHPRLWLTQNDLPRLQSWAVVTNPVYQQGLRVALTSAINTYNSKFFPGGVANPNWPDGGTINWEAYDTEAYAEFFAFVSLIDPDPTARATYAQYARDLLMHVMNEAVKGAAAGQPFRDPAFAINNRANYWGEAFGLTVDWLQYSNTLTTQDKATIRTVFLRWANENLNAATAYDDRPQPVGVMNNPQLLSNQQKLRWAANNYYSGHMRFLTMMALSLDAADDPPLNPSQPDTQLGNTLRSYIGNVTGAWLYQQYAMYEDANIVGAAYGLPAAGLGAASGGLSVEGFMYGHALGYVEEALLALHTAGYHDVALAGPQIRLIDSTFWDNFIDGFLHSITPTAQTPSVASGYAYLGPVYQMASYGDILRYWIAADWIDPICALGVYDQLTGNTTRWNKARWIETNAIEGGAAKLTTRAGGDIWGNSYASSAILNFMLFDPTAPPPVDPRPSLPTSFYASPIGRILARTDWTPNASWFDYKCTWESINHQLGDCGQFEFYRKGEWLTKERSGYAEDFIGATSDYHNTIGLQNDVPSNLQWFETATSQRGGQWTNGMNIGDPATRASIANGYVYAQSNMTNLYNRSGANDITHASRAIVWLKPDNIVVYDRATSKTANRFKRFNLGLLTNATINGKLATATSAGGQQLYIRNVLPIGATMVITPAETFRFVAQLEPSQYRLVIEDPSNPTDVRFLNVLQGADAGASADAVTLVQSTSGTPFDGVAVKNTVILFPVSMSATFTSVTYIMPPNTTSHLITGLTPNAGYDINIPDSNGFCGHLR